MSTEFLRDLGRELREQDNLATAHPIYLVEQQEKVWVGDYEQGIPGSKSEWVDEEGEVCDPGDPESREVYYVIRWKLVTPHLTRRAADRYIAGNSHNLSNPRVFVSSQYRCHEFNELIHWLKSLHEGQQDTLDLKPLRPWLEDDRALEVVMLDNGHLGGQVVELDSLNGESRMLAAVCSPAHQLIGDLVGLLEDEQESRNNTND